MKHYVWPINCPVPTVFQRENTWKRPKKPTTQSYFIQYTRGFSSATSVNADHLTSLKVCILQQILTATATTTTTYASFKWIAFYFAAELCEEYINHYQKLYCSWFILIVYDICVYMTMPMPVSPSVFGFWDVACLLSSSFPSHSDRGSRIQIQLIQSLNSRKIIFKNDCK